MLHLITTKKICICLLLGGLIGSLFLTNNHFRIYSYPPCRHVKSSSGIKLDVMTYNINSSDSTYKYNRDSICSFICGTDADIAVINELYTIGPSATNEYLKNYYPYSRKDSVNILSGVCIYSKYPIVKWAQLETSHEHNYIYIGLIDVDGTIIRVVAVHLCSNNYINNSRRADLNSSQSFSDGMIYYKRYCENAKKREESIAELLSLVSSKNYPTIILGDFNDLPSSMSIRMVEQVGYCDSWWKGGLGYGSTFKQGVLSLRLDHIFYNDYFDLCKVEIPEIDASDHKPIKASFLLKNY